GGGAYGAAKAGGSFELGRFVQQPQVLARIASAVSAGSPAFGSLLPSCPGSLLLDPSFPLARDPASDPCQPIPPLCGAACQLRICADLHLPPAPPAAGAWWEQSPTWEPGSCSLSPSCHLLPTGLWTFLWFIGFCFLTNQWSWTPAEHVRIGADSARAAITFSFFSIFSWVSALEPSP
ncbi:SNG2 protein, partial [Centropus unirufus]|nr:SNG2 protein [Centropus unirufus]